MARITSSHDTFNDVVLDHPFDPSPPLDTNSAWIILMALRDVGRPSANKKSENPQMKFVKTSGDNGAIGMKFVDDEFFLAESAIVLAAFWDRH